MTDWRLFNPEGVIPGKAWRCAPRPETLEGKTVLLRWNGKHNGDHFLNRIAELLTDRIEGLAIVRNWEVALRTRETSSSPQQSQDFAQALAAYRPDIVIGATGD